MLKQHVRLKDSFQKTEQIILKKHYKHVTSCGIIWYRLNGNKSTLDKTSKNRPELLRKIPSISKFLFSQAIYTHNFIINE